jgi:folylpolyglutamate synthase/dihydropteroate synthase
LKLITDQIVLTRTKHPRSHAFTSQEAHDLFGGKEWFLTVNVADALELALSKVKKDELIVVTGSLFVVAEARECINTKA